MAASSENFLSEDDFEAVCCYGYGANPSEADEKIVTD